jgi:hypothetical protein
MQMGQIGPYAKGVMRKERPTVFDRDINHFVAQSDFVDIPLGKGQALEIGRLKMVMMQVLFHVQPLNLISSPCILVRHSELSIIFLTSSTRPVCCIHSDWRCCLLDFINPLAPELFF